MPIFNYKCVLVISHNPDNISKKELHKTEFLVRGQPLLYGSVRLTSPTKKSTIINCIIHTHIYLYIYIYIYIMEYVIVLSSQNTSL